MTAVKTLALSVVAWAALGTLSACAEPVSQAKSSWPWTLFWPSSAVSSYEAAIATKGATTNADAVPAPPSSAVNAVAVAVAAPQPPYSAAPATSPVQTVSNVPTPVQTVDASINMTTGPYPEAGTLTTGGAQAWYDSPAVIQAFGGVPNSQQQASFTQTLLHDVQHTFQFSGMNPTLTTDPNVPALHTISVVSGTSYGANPSAIGITDVGSNGFSFIDKLNYASNPTDLAWAVAHNISHELMHAFGVGYHPDSGNSVDAGTASWSLLTDPNAQFGPAATQLLLASQYGTLSNGSVSGLGAELLNPEGTKIDGDEVLPQAIPEPTTVAVWVFATLGGVILVRRRRIRGVA